MNWSNDHSKIVDGHTKLYGIIGDPVSHSFSPQMQSSAFMELGLNSIYLPFSTQKEKLPDLIKAFWTIGMQGFNVTLPFKVKIIPLLKDLDQDADLLQSVNTVVRTPHDWKGYTTDGIGFIEGLSELSLDIKNKRIGLIGAGGSAKSIALALSKLEIHSLVILNRTKDSAEELKRLTLKLRTNLEIQIETLDWIGKLDMLINATSVGMDGLSCPIQEKLIAKSKIAIDIIYTPKKTPFLKIAESKKIPILNGIPMLLYQGVKAFEIWTGTSAPVTLMKDSLNQSLKTNFNL